MPMLVSADVKGQTKEGYDGILMALRDPLKKSPGFVFHSSYAIDGGWRVIEVWQSKSDADQWYAKYVAPNLPPGITPKRSYQELHSIVTP